MLNFIKQFNMVRLVIIYKSQHLSALKVHFLEIKLKNNVNQISVASIRFFYEL